MKTVVKFFTSWQFLMFASFVVSTMIVGLLPFGNTPITK